MPAAAFSPSGPSSSSSFLLGPRLGGQAQEQPQPAEGAPPVKTRRDQRRGLGTGYELAEVWWEAPGGLDGHWEEAERARWGA